MTNDLDGVFASHMSTLRTVQSVPAAPTLPSGLVAVPETAASVVGLFPAYTNAVTNVCATGIFPATTSVFLRAHCPAAGDIEVYASPTLATNVWSDLGSASVSGGGWVFELPHALLPGGWPSAMFFSLAMVSDTDGDGLSDVCERLVAGTDPACADTDGDGLGDGDEIAIGSSPTSGDTDSDGLSDAAEMGVVDVTPSSGTLWQSMSSYREITTGSSYSDSGSYVFDLPHPYTVNGVAYTQVRLCADGVIYLLNPDRPNWSYRQVFGNPPSLASDYFCDNHVAIAAFCTDLYLDAPHWGSSVFCGSAYVDWRPVSVIEVDRIGFESDCYTGERHLFSYQLVLPSEEENVFYLAYMVDDSDYCVSRNPTIGVQIPMLPPQFADERYYHLTWKPTAGSFADTLRLKFTIGRGTDPTSSDTDGDGLSDREEVEVFGTDPKVPDDDTDADGLPDAMEIRMGTDPELTDTDCDGLDDYEEFVLGTDPLQPDTDGDGLNDGWEAKYDGQLVYSGGGDGSEPEAGDGLPVHFDPLVDNDYDPYAVNDTDADPDGDGLTNEEECALGSNPCRSDTDGDGVPDGVEAGQGSDPTDSTDGGAAGSRVRVTFYFGDHSGSHSEKYRLTVTPVSGDGVRPSGFAWLNEHYGQCEQKDAFLKPGWRYEVRLAHAGTKPGESADYDYTLRQVGTLPPNVIVVDDDSLFGVDETSSSFAGEGKVAHVYVVGRPRLVFDYDRDGKIDDADVAKAKAGVTFRFWCNEDTGKGDYVGQSTDVRPNWEADPELSQVKGKLDLVNLFPAMVDVSAVSKACGDAATFLLRCSPDRLRFCRLAGAQPERSCAIQTESVRTAENEALEEAALQSLDSAGVEIDEWLDEEGRAMLAFMAGGPVDDLSSPELVVSIGGREVLSCRIPLSIVHVREMYNWINSRRLSGETEVRPSWLGAPSCGSGKTLVFLHGANVSEPDAEKWGDAIYKRLWWAGADVDFYNVDWRSDIGSSANYHENASNAFAVAEQLASTIAAIPGQKTIMAHSLGNMVVSSMIQDHRLQVHKYLMCNSAVPAEAYDPDLSLRVPQLVHPDWEEYPTNTWTASYHSLFDEFPDDDRRHLGWLGRFADVAQYAVNFYSTGDEVLEMNDGNDMNVFVGILSSLGRYSWHKQELFKGRGVIDGLGGTDWSGWRFNGRWRSLHPAGREWEVRYTPEQASGFSPEQLRAEPVFYPYPSSMTNSVIPLLVRAAHLTKGVPALTPATGRTGLGDILGDDKYFDENIANPGTGISKPHGWPVRSPYGTRWLHSDIKDVALRYSYKLFEKIIEVGGLR